MYQPLSQCLCNYMIVTRWQNTFSNQQTATVTLFADALIPDPLAAVNISYLHSAVILR